MHHCRRYAFRIILSKEELDQSVRQNEDKREYETLLLLLQHVSGKEELPPYIMDVDSQG